MTAMSGQLTKAEPTAEGLSTLLEVRDLVVEFGGLRALDGASLTVPSGARVGLIGPNGAGKTTLFNAVCGFVKCAEGDVILAGEEVNRVSPNGRARLGLARTFQHPKLTGDLTALQNVMFGVHEPTGVRLALAELAGLPGYRRQAAAAQEEGRELLAFVGAGQHAETPVDRLPLGVHRRVELARAFMAKPQVVLLDEPASGMDTREAEQLLVDLLELQRTKGTAVLVIEHNMRFLMNAVDHVYVLDAGRLLAEGTPDEVRADPRVAAAYLGTQEDTA